MTPIPNYSNYLIDTNCKTLGLSTSKACVAIQQKKPIKGYYLDYA